MLNWLRWNYIHTMQRHVRIGRNLFQPDESKTFHLGRSQSIFGDSHNYEKTLYMNDKWFKTNELLDHSHTHSYQCNTYARISETFMIFRFTVEFSKHYVMLQWYNSDMMQYSETLK